MRKFVWDTSAIINIKEPDSTGYSAGNSLIKDLWDWWIPGPYQNIFPALAVFEVNAGVSRKKRDGSEIHRDFFLLNEHSVLYPIDEVLISRSHELFTRLGFDQLRGADLVFACIAYIERAYLVTLDKHVVKSVSGQIAVIDLNESHASPEYRTLFDKNP